MIDNMSNAQFVCEHCKKIYSSKSNLNGHRKKCAIKKTHSIVMDVVRNSH